MAGSRTVAEPLGLLDAGLDLADAGQVLVELLRSCGAEPALHRARRRRGRSRGPTAAPAAACEVRPPLAGRAGAEEALEGEAGVGLGRPSAWSASSRRGCTGRRRSSPSRSRRTCVPESQASSSEGNRVRWPISRAITWSIETPARMSVALFLSRTPVRNVPLPRAWSPAPSGPASAVLWSSRRGPGSGP